MKKKLEEGVQAKTKTKILRRRCASKNQNQNFTNNKKLAYHRWKDTKMCVSSGDRTRMSKENHVFSCRFNWLKPHP
jgi:hypothetical protein